MKKKTMAKAAICAGAVAVSATLLAGCDRFRPDEMNFGTVYGPPPFEDDYDPAENDTAPVYGPPEDGEDYEPSDESQEWASWDWDPSDQGEEWVYGSPDDW